MSAPIPIRIQPFFWLLAAFIGWIGTNSIPETLLWVGIIFISILVHEMGHALTARAFGQRAAITLTAMGGVTQRSGKKLKLWQEFLIVFNGPFAGFLLVVASFILLMAFDTMLSQVVKYVLTVTLYINAFWTVFNLCPVQPLDGGHLLSVVLQSIFGFAGIRLSYFIGMCLAGVFGLVSFAVGLLFPGVFFFFFTFENYRSWSAFRGMTESDSNKSLWREIHDADDQAYTGDYEGAFSRLEKVRHDVPDGKLNVAAAEHQGNILVRQGKIKEAYELLMPLKQSLSEEFLALLQQLAFQTGHIKVAVSLGDEVYQETPSYQVALINAMCYALLGEEEAAVGWLYRTRGDNAPDFVQLLQRPEFDHIRTSAAFQELLRG